MKCVTEKSEDKIREAAKRVFLKKGFDGTTSRDIAKEADMNIALTNYYFRSKEKLFLEIFKDVLEEYFQNMLTILNKDIDIKSKISEIIDNDFAMMKQEPDLVIFIMNEIHKSPQRLFPDMSIFRQVRETHLKKQLEEGAANGTLRPMQLENILPLIKCGVEFIFMGKEIHKELFMMTDEDFEKYAEEQKEHIKAMVCNYLVIG
ncbi:AcrR family transcriptional regulator [Dyadobacter sp. BE34]|uniref:AcrR family transcriptional regulator n=1 Tax=Dyadobacter fermentans TaxID=94254 RepID=A0ABU1R1Q0_9BACT|nr:MULTISPECIES: TetR/AcrR family transcriptional regulator [Dyadobacter]MDR6807278.1 AcrR family transcriptional regulator [Dyadobacter fermentans]MDR7045019.1 AcrR family transcriptional regulator [Dyadobacter sp. BE242]MDR7199245.1 AcrR family transcriptional regulator [Dyadobacter sp. BE34]MDR7217205.1 AcrR family transcriptional regulator [Dyadobacter sp. BE31]MDR7265138.1 AcrR family transcriptional regulator [Dyadobacter sp. BE32]